MTSDARMLARLLRQVADLGGPDLYLDERTAAELRALATLARTRDVHSRGVAGTGATTATSGLETMASAPAPATVETRRALDVLSAAAAGCTRCRLLGDRTNAVFGEGHPNADVAVVGEAPGQEEDRTGRPFVGRAGRMLDLLLLTAGFPRENVYICNVLKCRPPGNRNPLPDEIDQCTTHFLHAQLEAVAPRAMVAVGRFAVQALLGTDESIGRLRGRIHTYRGIPVIVSYHPAYLLRSPNMARTAWEDFQLLRTVLDEQA
jgi:DNA polymerase